MPLIVRHRWIACGAIGLATVAALGAVACRAPGRFTTPPPPTFNKDVAPIVFANCAPCHRPGEVAPFSLLSYADAAKHADRMASETRQRHMPPWLPERGEFPVVGERRLSEEQIATIQRWVDAGAPEGHPADLPAPPSFPGGWQLGRPDVVLTLAKPYTLEPGGEDVYRSLVLRSPLSADMFVRGVELRTNGAPIHHAVIRV